MPIHIVPAAMALVTVAVAAEAFGVILILPTCTSQAATVATFVAPVTAHGSVAPPPDAAAQPTGFPCASTPRGACPLGQIVGTVARDTAVCAALPVSVSGMRAKGIVPLVMSSPATPPQMIAEPFQRYNTLPAVVVGQEGMSARVIKRQACEPSRNRVALAVPVPRSAVPRARQVPSPSQNRLAAGVPERSVG
jgi:hypothetical protein